MAVMVARDLDGPAAVRERLEAFGAEVLAEAVNRPVQLINGGVYLRGLIEQGPRKSLEPMVARLGGEADYESLQQFLAVSTWDPALVVRTVAERDRYPPRSLHRPSLFHRSWRCRCDR